MSTLSLYMTAMMLTHKLLGGHFDWRSVLLRCCCCYGYAYLRVTSVCTFFSVTCGDSGNDGKWRESATSVPVLSNGSSSFPNLEVMTFWTQSEAKNYLRMTTYWLIEATLPLPTPHTVPIFSVFHIIFIFVPLSFPPLHSLGFSLLLCYPVKLLLLLCAQFCSGKKSIEPRLDSYVHRHAVETDDRGLSVARHALAPQARPAGWSFICLTLSQRIKDTVV